MPTGGVMAEAQHLTAELLAKLDGVEQLSPSAELATYEHVLGELTQLLNSPEASGPGAY